MCEDIKIEKTKKHKNESWVRSLFIKKDNNNYLCIVCRKKYKSEGTSHLHTHLKGVHEKIYQEFIEKIREGKDVKNELEFYIKKYKKDIDQKKLDEFLKRNETSSSTSNDFKIINWMKIGIKYALSFSFMGSPEIINFMQNFHNSNRNLLSECYLTAIYEFTKMKLLKELKEVKECSLTTDSWSCKNGSHYIAVTCHYLD
jgi:hypothetical protein